MQAQEKASDMKTRDWLATQALIGVLGSPLCPPLQPGANPQQLADRMARLSYELADAMLRAGEPKQPKP